MGISTKYVKDKVKTKVDREGYENEAEQLLFVEYQFYKNLQRRVFFVGAPASKKSEHLWERILNYWSVTCADEDQGKIARELPDSFIHPQYRSVYDDEIIIDNKESKLFQVQIGKATRETHVVKLAEKSCQIVSSTAFVIFDYVWEYTIKDKGLLARENGTFSQVWVQENAIWMLLGESGGPVTR